MTKDELKKETEEYFEEQPHSYADTSEQLEEDIVNAYLASAEPREKRIEELEQQIEEMKCCGNCLHRRYWGNELGCHLDYDKEDECNHYNKKYWEFKQEQ